MSFPEADRELTTPMFAPADPSDRVLPTCSPSTETKYGRFFAIWFWKTTLPMVIDIEVANCRTNWKVDVAVAMSRGATRVWSAIKGDWKFVPTPTPAII